MQGGDEQPLARRRIAITRAAERAEGLADRLRALGAEPLICPTIAYAPPADCAPLDTAARNLARYDWLMLTSAAAVAALWARVDMTGAPARWPRIAAVGQATAAALAQRGAAAALVPTLQSAEGLLAEIDAVDGLRVLIPAADIAREALADGLRARGAMVDVVVAYRTMPGPGAQLLLAPLRARALDALVLTSPSTLRYLLGGLAELGVAQAEIAALLDDVSLICIGPTTATAAREAGLRPVVAPTASAEGVVAALVATLAHQPS